jgi:hypothetical protein
LSHHQTAQNAFNELAIIGTKTQVHPLFVNFGRLTNNKASDVKGFFILLTRLVIELLGSGLMFALSKAVLGPLPTLNPPINTTPVMRPTETETHTIPTGTNNTIHPLLEQVTNDILTGELKNLSFRTLQRKYQIGASTAQFIHMAGSPRFILDV